MMLSVIGSLSLQHTTSMTEQKSHYQTLLEQQKKVGQSQTYTLSHFHWNSV